MTYVPGYAHDIFVSYAHVDNELLPGTDQGWVTTLVGCIKTRLAQILGRREVFDLWWDPLLSNHVNITPQLLEKLNQTAVLVVVLSPGYIASPWCKKEKDTFLDLIKKHGGSRIFVVERDIVDQSDRPPEFTDIKGFRFWIKDREGRRPRILGSPKPDPSDIEYYSLVDDLSDELASELRNLKTTEPAYKTLYTNTSFQPTVFLAQVTDDLENERNSVKRYLKQAGINVLPDTWYSQEPNAFRSAAQRDLEDCKLFVQLLSNVAGKKPDDLPQGYVKLQIELAQKTNIPIIQWRNPELKVDSNDSEHSSILVAETVRAEGIEEFKRDICQKAFEHPEANAKFGGAFVFVNLESSDRALAEEVCQELVHSGVDYILPVRSTIPADNRRDLEDNLLNCDGIIIIYGQSNVTWVRRQLLESRKVLAMRESPLRVFAVYEGPPEEKDGLDIKLHNLKVLDFRKGLDKSRLRTFLADLQPEIA